MATFGKTGGPQLEIVKESGADGVDITQNSDGDLLCGGVPLLTKAVVFMEQAADEALSTTTSTTMVSKLSHTTTTITETADYKIEWQFSISNSVADSGVVAKFVIAGIKEGGAQFKPDASNGYSTFSGFKRVNLTGNVTIDIDFKALANTAKIEDVRLYITKEV